MELNPPHCRKNIIFNLNYLILNSKLTANVRINFVIVVLRIHIIISIFYLQKNVIKNEL